MDRTYWVYILASRRNGTIYTGVTNDLSRRVHEHKTKAVPGFTSRYGVHLLVWYEFYGDVNEAIAREKQLKKGNRAWKLELIEVEPELARSLPGLECVRSRLVMPAKAGIQGDSPRLRP